MDVMIDIETLGTLETSAVISIGACEMDLDKCEIGRTFYERIDFNSALDRRTFSPETLMWWMQQSDKARQDVIGGKTLAKEALHLLSLWLPEKPVVWGNGATFDISMLENLYTSKGVPVPWGFRDIRDMRTIAALGAADYAEIESTDTIAHRAVDDAIWQARYVCLAWSRIKTSLKQQQTG